MATAKKSRSSASLKSAKPEEKESGLTWGQRRALRREKQRAENPERARKMREARLEFEKQQDLFAAPEIALDEKYYIGCSGWFYWDWRGKFYPQDMQTSGWFDFYMKRFKTVELNAPFYSWPTVATVKGWKRQLGRKKFIYTVKASELITHVKRFENVKTLVKDFGLIADLLEEHMGCLLFQFPPSFKYSPGRLKNIVSQIDPGRRNVVEFRHKSWWNEDVYTAFREKNIIFCSCSGPKLPDDLIKTADDIYVRFHGVERWYRYKYSKAEMEEWAQKIHAAKAKHAWIYFNNDWDANAIKDARQLARALRRLEK